METEVTEFDIVEHHEITGNYRVLTFEMMEKVVLEGDDVNADNRD